MDVLQSIQFKSHAARRHNGGSEMSSEKSAYICGPLTELTEGRREWAKGFYVDIAQVCLEEAGVRAFVPHEHYDPVKNAKATPIEVDVAERHQVCKRTSILIVVALEPSWGGGIEVEMANQSGVPVLVLCEEEKLEARKISRLLRGNPAVAAIIPYDHPASALDQLRNKLRLLPVIV
jgi:hypothetical protein